MEWNEMANNGWVYKVILQTFCEYFVSFNGDSRSFFFGFF